MYFRDENLSQKPIRLHLVSHWQNWSHGPYKSGAGSIFHEIKKSSLNIGIDLGYLNKKVVGTATELKINGNRDNKELIAS